MRPLILSFNYLTKRSLLVKAALISLRFYNHHHLMGPGSVKNAQWWEISLFKVGQIVWLRSACKAPKHLFKRRNKLLRKCRKHSHHESQGARYSSRWQTRCNLSRAKQSKIIISGNPKLTTQFRVWLKFKGAKRSSWSTVCECPEKNLEGATVWPCRLRTPPGTPVIKTQPKKDQPRETGATKERNGLLCASSHWKSSLHPD